MTAQETIKFLKETAAGCKITRDKQLLNVCNISIQALERQIPKKVEFGNGLDPRWDTCPACEYQDIEEEKPNFCPCCGQALDWSDENA